MRPSRLSFKLKVARMELRDLITSRKGIPLEMGLTQKKAEGRNVKMRL